MTLDPQEEWPRLVALERDAAKTARNVGNDRASSKKQRADALRAWWSTVSAVLTFYVRTLKSHGFTLEPMPADILILLAHLSEDLSNGIVHPILDDVYITGRRTMWRKQRHDIAKAIYYIEAVRRGEIKDPHPIKTVREQFGVLQRTVQRWIERRNKICTGAPGGGLGYAPDDIREAMVFAGGQYQFNRDKGLGRH